MRWWLPVAVVAWSASAQELLHTEADLAELKPGDATTMYLSEGTVVGTVERTTSPRPGLLILSGGILDDPLGSLTLVAEEGRVSQGILRTREADYLVGRDEYGRLVVHMEPQQTGWEELLKPPPAATDPWADDPPGNTTASTTIDLGVFYTEAVRRQFADVQTTMAAIVADAANMAGLSGTGITLNAATIRRVTHTGVRGNGDDHYQNLLDWFTRRGNREMDEVHAVRDAVAADVMVLLMRDREAEYCGIAWGSPEPWKTRSGLAFAVVNTACGGLGTIAKITAHEIGHTFGLLHDRYVSCEGACPKYHNSYAYGHTNPRGLLDGSDPDHRWFTLMAYSRRCGRRSGCRWIARYSNPLQTHNGDPLGVAATDTDADFEHNDDGPADATRQMAGRASRTAAYRTEPAGRPPLTAQLWYPTTHDTQVFEIGIELSEGIEDLSYRTVENWINITGAKVLGARRVEPPKNDKWFVTIKPDRTSWIQVRLPKVDDCDDDSAMCTADGRGLQPTTAMVVGPFAGSFKPDGDKILLEFSEHVPSMSYTTLEKVIEVTNGTIKVFRHDRSSSERNKRWTIDPTLTADTFSLELPKKECSEEAAVCTDDGRQLFETVRGSFRVTTPP